jgi:tetraacyldisaccharide 4'-kinase
MLKKAGIETHIGNRIENIKELNRSPVADCRLPIIMDDGFQNPTIKKDISVLVFDESIGLGNGFVLPAGPLREPISAVARADAVIIIGRQSPVLGRQSFINKIKKYKKPVFFAKSKTILKTGGQRIVAFAGIGYPRKFFDALKPAPVCAIAFPDHYQYTPADLEKMFKKAGKKNAQLITTEKDWVRLPAYAQKKIKFAKLEMTIEPAFWKWLGERLK